MSSVGLKAQSRGCISHRYALHQRSRNVRCRAEAASGITTIGKHLQDYGGALIPGCYDALSARLMAKQGYKVRSDIHVKRGGCPELHASDATHTRLTVYSCSVTTRTCGAACASGSDCSIVVESAVSRCPPFCCCYHRGTLG